MRINHFDTFNYNTINSRDLAYAIEKVTHNYKYASTLELNLLRHEIEPDRACPTMVKVKIYVDAYNTKNRWTVDKYVVEIFRGKDWSVANIRCKKIETKNLKQN